ncbi:DMT family transporter [Thiospirochaeta perfilievii]|uniref:DMT family transporter n=1 Tax=Thiospirochaeta perfilievii TaxID=252967 RepID=UPI001CA8A859|nr:DMT family transporter [Thiospirochaeta perfilievii]
MANYLGEISAFGTVFCWVICSIAFESAGKKIGSMPVNIIRLVMAFIFISIFTLFSRGLFFPVDATPKSWFWLSLSGVVGLFIGDLCLFRAFVLIGSRISLLIYSLAPPISALLGFFMFKETMSIYAIVGMFITIFGIGLVILKKDNKRYKFSHPLEGVLLAIIGAVGQAFGIGLSKLGMALESGGTYDPIASTQIRIISATVCFIILFFITKRWSYVFKSFKDLKAIGDVAIGSFFGPFIGVTLSLVAITYTSMGIASTITSILPVAIIVPHVFIYKTKIFKREVFGAIVAVFGVSLLFI